MFDHCANGQQLKCLTVTDEFTKEGLGDRRRRSHPLAARDRGAVAPGERARRAEHSCAATTARSSYRKALLSWIVAQGIGTALIEPGKPWQNGVTESFNGKFRDECLSLEWFRSRAEAKVIIEDLAAALQRGAAAFEPRLSDAERVRGSRSNSAPRQATGRDAAVYGAFAPRPVAQPPRRGQMQQAREAVSS